MLLALLIGLSAGRAQAPADPRWAVVCSRLLGAHGTVRDRAWRVAQTAERILADGRQGHMSALAADVRELDLAVASAQLAVEAAEEGLSGP